MRVAVVGSRGFPEPALVRYKVAKMLTEDDTLISGGARGVDTWAEQVASDRGVATDIYLADWDQHGKRAGFLRNRTIVNEADFVLAFWDGESKGTRHSIKLAMEAGKPLNVYVRKPQGGAA